MHERILFCLVLLACLFSTGCVTHYSSAYDPAKTALTTQESAQASSYKFNVPCRITVNASDDMVGHNKTIWYDTPFGFKDIYHYQLRTLLNDCFSSVVYGPFDRPKGNIVDSFELKLEPQMSEFLADGNTARYKLVLYITCSEPGGKKIVSWSIEKSNSGPLESRNEVPNVVYATMKETAMDVLKRISTDNKVMAVISRYSDK